ncbi:MAG TPA: hypothetical protein VNO30_04165 [Kofleriaceae bacterium]|nr:hypothetical protein [Kofleriaceae bacterium]
MITYEAAVEADREGSRRGFVRRAADPHDMVDVREQRIRLHLAEAGAKNDQLDRGSSRAECLGQRCGRDELSVPLRGLEEQAVLSAVTAEVNHRRLELTQPADQIQRLHRPPGHELEAIPEAAALQLRLDRPHFSVDGPQIGSARVGGQI